MTHLLNLLTAVPFFSRTSSIFSGTVLLVGATAFLAVMIERKSRTRIARKLGELKKLLPTTIRLSRDGHESFENINAVQLGCTFVVRAGECSPTDGIIEEGTSLIDESVWTGDSSPQTREPGQTVTAGTLNLEDTLRVRATHLPAESTLSRSVATLESAFSSRLSLDTWVDYVNRLAFPGMILAAVAVFLILWSSGLTGFQDSLLRGIAMALIAYPLAGRYRLLLSGSNYANH